MASKKTLLLVIVLSPCGNVLGLTDLNRGDRIQEVDALMAQLADRAGWRQAIDVLAEVGAPAVEPLGGLLRDKDVQPWSIKSRAIQALTRIGTPEATEIIVQCLKDDEANEYVRSFAALAVGQLKPQGAVGVLAQAVTDDRQIVRWKVVQALGQFESEEAVDALLRALSDEDRYVRAVAIESLGEIGSDRAAHGLIDALGDEHWRARLNARQALTKVGPGAVGQLLAALGQRNNSIRWQAAWVLGRLRAEKAVEPLAGLLGDDDWMVSDEAAVALVRIKPSKAGGILLETCRNGNARTRRQVAWVVDKLESDRAVVVVPEVPSSRRPDPNEVCFDGRTYPCYPAIVTSKPELPSPHTTAEGVELITTRTRDGCYTVMAVTVENGTPLNYKQRQWGKGRQLTVDGADFPTLARTRLHSAVELNGTKMIAGRSIAEITELGRPERSSGAGFMAADEDIVSVLAGDNEIVRRLGLTHPEMARPLFHVWNLMLRERQQQVYNNTEYILYRGKEVCLSWLGTKGWQESLFDDGILGMYQFEASRDLDASERAFLANKYPDLGEPEMAHLVEKLSSFHAGEMVPYYIMRYGFYEGHTDYRADPIAVAFIFNLKSLSEIEAAFPTQLYSRLTTHFTSYGQSNR